MLFPPGQDANAFALGVEDPAGALAELLRSAVWLGAGRPTAALRAADPVVEVVGRGGRASTPPSEHSNGDRAGEACSFLSR